MLIDALCSQYFENKAIAPCKTLPEYGKKEFNEYLKCGRLEYVSLRVRCAKGRYLEAKVAGVGCDI
jgi:hypothetical protein